MDPSIFFQEEEFPELIRERLSFVPIDYQDQFAFLQKMRLTSTPWEGAGILLPLLFAKLKKDREFFPPQYVFLLNKRSRLVQQAGDLCAPGGGIKPIDKIFQKIIQSGLLPWWANKSLSLTRKRDHEVYKQILLVLSNALRESWEEIRLNPFNLEFLGALPAYRLQSRCWIMFPVVGRVKRAWKPKLNWEVEKIIPLPLAAFLDEANYALYSLEVPQNLKQQGIPHPWEFPCLVYRVNGEEEILWGATYMVIRSFFHTIFPFPLPSPNGQRIIRRPLLANYFSGKEAAT